MLWNKKIDNKTVREAEKELHLTVFLIRTAERLSLEKFGKEIDVKRDRIKIPFLLVKLYPTVDTVLPGSLGNFPWRQAAEDLHLLR